MNFEYFMKANWTGLVGDLVNVLVQGTKSCRYVRIYKYSF